jgi:hypothetical protein
MRRRNSCAYYFGFSERKTRSDSRLAGNVISSVLEPPTDNDSEQEGSLPGSIAVKDPAASSLAKGPASRGRQRLLIAAVDSKVWCCDMCNIRSL